MIVKKVKKPKKRLIARVKCKGDFCNANHKVLLEGVTDCATAEEMRGEDEKSCSYGCLGYGSCYEACPFDAIEMKDGVAVIITDKCKGCRKCVRVCPRDVIEMLPISQEVFVDCNSNNFGKSAKETCKVACIGCQMCVKVCPFFAMNIEDKLAFINYNMCTNCGLCADKCPTKAITANFDLKPRVVADISQDKCIGCTVCAQICPVAAIEGYRGETHVVNKDMCVSCTICARVCPVSAIEMIEKVKPIKDNKKTAETYEKELIKYYDDFNEIKNLNERIDYNEVYKSDNFHGSLSLSKVSKLEHSNNFEVVYKGELSNS